ASAPFFIPPARDTNLLGFNAKPAGHRSNDGEFIREGTESDIWSSTDYPGCTNGVARLYSNEDHLITDQWMLHCESGNSVRCIKD
ncbi:MAG: FISUMP domain-containing protein, partial [Bacteroidota bacterium]|nr:FISUMP domain-containing protein [Bacteroidota bacterium]